MGAISLDTFSQELTTALSISCTILPTSRTRSHFALPFGTAPRKTPQRMPEAADALWRDPTLDRILPCHLELRQERHRRECLRRLMPCGVTRRFMSVSLRSFETSFRSFLSYSINARCEN